MVVAVAARGRGWSLGPGGGEEDGDGGELGEGEAAVVIHVAAAKHHGGDGGLLCGQRGGDTLTAILRGVGCGVRRLMPRLLASWCHGVGDATWQQGLVRLIPGCLGDKQPVISIDSELPEQPEKAVEVCLGDSVKL